MQTDPQGTAYDPAEALARTRAAEGCPPGPCFFEAEGLGGCTCREKAEGTYGDE